MVSDIYIDRNFSSLFDFWISENDQSTALIGATDTDTIYVDEDETTRDNFDFIIYVPVAVFTALGSSTQNRENAIRIFANKLNAVGFKYKVDTY